jgi:ATP phosphoribosyltransferase
MDDNFSVTLALSKGRILDETLPFLKGMGIQLTDNPDLSRKLVIGTTKPELRIVLVRASDVPTYVQRGAADLGIAGKDVLVEQDGDGLFEPVDLGIARCKMMVAARADFDYDTAIKKGSRIRVATKYVRSARTHFGRKGVYVDLIKLYGSMELAPIVGLADAIVDLVSSGETLRANKLKPVEEIMAISSRLIVSASSLKLKRDIIKPLIDGFRDFSLNKVS